MNNEVTQKLSIEIQLLITEAKQQATVAVNATLTMLSA